MLKTRIKNAICCAPICVALSAQPTQAPLTDQRIAELVSMGVSTNEIFRIIATAPKFSFNLSPTDTDAMIKAGVSEDIIKAMAARESGVRVAPPMNTPQPSSVLPTNRVSDPNKALVSHRTDGRSYTLYQGTPVRLRIMRTVSSADAQVGNNVDFQTLDDIRQNGIVVIPKASTAIATITVAESKKRMARGGKLGMNIDFVRLPNGEQLALRGVQDLKGGGHTGAMTGAMVATAIVLWPAAPFFLFMHGKDVTIPEGHEVTVYTNTDYTFNADEMGLSSQMR